MQQEIAEAINGNKIIIYPELGRDAYTEKYFGQIISDLVKINWRNKNG